MAASTTTSGFSLHLRVPSRSAPAVAVRNNRPRRITPDAGHALEKIGHAIEYLTDEFVHNGGDFREHDPQVEAVQLLMALNREVYFSCPEMPSWGDRFRALVSRSIH